MSATQRTRHLTDTPARTAVCALLIPAVAVGLLVALTFALARSVPSLPAAVVVVSALAVAAAAALTMWLSRQLRQSALPAEQEVRRQARIDSLLRGSTDIIGMLDDEGIITYINRATSTVHGYEPSKLIGTSVFDLFHPADRGKVLRATATNDLDGGVQVAHRMFDADGKTRHVETMVSRPDGQEGGFILNVRDVTDRKALEAEIYHHAHHDVLTDLANRRAFTARLEDALGRAEHTGVPVGLIMLDLDEFKPVNDTYGHQAGDEVLVNVAERLTRGVRDADMPARMGGDEFAVIVHDGGDIDEVAALACRLHADVAAPIKLGRGVSCSVTASVGIAASWDGCTADELLREADQHLYVDKRARQKEKAGL